MTAAERFWLRVNRRAADRTPEVAAAMLRAFQILRDRLTPAQLAAVVARGDVEAVVRAALTEAVLDAAFAPVRDRIRRTTADGVRYFARDLPKGGKLDGTLVIRFDALNPRTIDATRALDTKVITGLKADVREVVRASVEQGLRTGVAPREVARGLRDVIGLAPNQLEAVDNFRRALRGVEGAGSPFTRTLRDRRFDGTIRAGDLTAAQVEKMTDAYRRRMVAFNANTHARTATTDALKLGQRLSWQDAVDKGFVPGGRLMHQWIGVNDNRERPEHVAMNDQVQPFDQPYSNGQMVPGETDYNCRCQERFFVAPS